MFRIRSWLVYARHAAAGTVARIQPPAVRALPITESLLHESFRNDPGRLSELLRVHSTGARGMLLVDPAAWIAYGWISIAAQGRPVHLPRHITKSRPFWIHTCHVRKEFRGRGLYRELLAGLVQIAFDEFAATTVWIDTGAANLPSRRGILRSGFEPRGVVRVLHLWLPKLLFLPVRARWCATELHPRFPEVRPHGMH